MEDFYLTLLSEQQGDFRPADLRILRFELSGPGELCRDHCQITGHILSVQK